MSSLAASTEGSEIPPAVAELIEANCFDCHGESTQEAGLRLDNVTTSLDAGDTWQSVRDRVAAGEMPPPDDWGELDEEDKTAIVGWLDEWLDDARLRKQAEGAMTLRRLTKRQYAQSLHELLGVPLEFAANLPEDAKGALGFSGSIAAQETSPLHIEYYEAIARRALSRAIALGPKPESQRFRVTLGRSINKPSGAAEIRGYQSQPIRRRHIRFEQIGADGQPLPLATDEERAAAERIEKHVGVGMRGSDRIRYRVESDGIWLAAATPQREVSPDAWRAPSPNAKMLLRRLVDLDGPFKIRVRARSAVPEGDDRQPWLRAFIGSRTDDGLEYRTVGESTPVDPDGEWREFVFEGDSASVPLPGYDPGETDPLTGVLIVGVWNDHLIKNKLDTGPTLVVESIELETANYPQWPPASHEAIFFSSSLRETDERAYTEEVIRRFAERAFRRPVRADEVEPYVANWEAVAPEFDSYEAGVMEALVPVLCSPRFLYLDSTPDEHALASRLSYFLWQAPPDERLLGLAEEGRLTANLDAEVERMLRDDRAWPFYRTFVGEWLRLDRQEGMQTSARRYPDYSRFVKQDMAEETVRFFREVIVGERSIETLIDADFTMLTQNLAEFYGIPGVRGNEFVRVALNGARPGGLLSQGAFLNGHSDGVEPHAIKRAMWVRSRVLGDPPPVPPPNVPELERVEGGTQKLTLKQRLQQHRDNPSCLSCHVDLDPWGFAFEGLDAVGRPRSKRERFDNTAEFPDGTTVKGVEELRDYLLRERRHDLVHSLAKHLFAFATGRQVTFVERPEIEHIVERSAADGRLITMVKAVVSCDNFLGQAADIPVHKAK